MYSQNLEEKIILEYFGNYKGSFLDCGANNGITFSNTRALAEIGWRGVFIEPSPKAFYQLKQLYEKERKGNFYVHNCAIGDHNGDAILQESGPLCSAQDVALVSTFIDHEMNRFKSTVTYEPIKVKMYRWKTFFNRLYIKTFDFISIDVEGMEAVILKQMDLEKMKVKMLCLEWNGNESMKSEFDKLCAGYNIIYKSPENLIYAK